MSKKHAIRCYDYVNHPYTRVCDLLIHDAGKVFHAATNSAESRAGSVAAGLHVNVAGLEIGKEININVYGLEQVENNRDTRSALLLEWQAAEQPGLFPVMKGELAFYPISAKETQLDFQGDYEPPLGILGKAIDAMVGHRIAEASVHHFISEVAAWLRDNIVD
ncbi:MAG: hypothetical protein ACR2NP_16715 [Pirellulaceae bacterium]